MTTGRWQAVYAVGALGWALGLWPAAFARGTNLGSAAHLTSSVLYAAGAVVCHQRPERSFAFAGASLPVCARCTGIYVAAACTAMLMMATSRRAVATPSTSVPDRARTWRTVLIALLPTLLTVGWEWIQGDAPSNPVRFAAGVPLGAVVSWIVLRAN